jgi:predicted lipoprotein with Yx(FWY)xxD motif
LILRARTMFEGIPRAACWVAAAFAALLAAVQFYGSPHEAASTASAPIPLATPPGITLQLRARGDRTRVSTLAQALYGDARGMSLYTYDRDTQGTSACTGECAAEWPAAPAPPAAAPGGDWTVLARLDGTKQWAFRGAPLYRFADDKAIGDAAGDGAAGGLWHVAVFSPGAGMALPDGIAVREIADAAGAGLVDSMGMTLYAFDGDAADPRPSCAAGDCPRLWVPLEAPEIAGAVGVFSVIARDDGIAQWTYEGKPLYQFAGDRRPGEANGMSVDAGFHVALVMRFFLPGDAAIVRTAELGNILTAQHGATLYQRDRVTTEELHPFRTDHGTPALGRALGTSTCGAACTKAWHPFVAPADALASGYWEIATRADGTRQWVYKGFALYTYAADKPGDIGGNAIYDIGRVGDPILPAGDFPGAGVGALFWHAVVP